MSRNFNKTAAKTKISKRRSFLLLSLLVLGIFLISSYLSADKGLLWNDERAVIGQNLYKQALIDYEAISSKLNSKKLVKQQDITKNWQDLVANLQKVSKDFPNLVEAQQSLLLEGKLFILLYKTYNQQHFISAALVALETLVLRYPQQEYSSEAIYILAQAYELAGKPQKAKQQYQSLKDLYPKNKFSQQVSPLLTNIQPIANKGDQPDSKVLSATQNKNQIAKILDIQQVKLQGLSRTILQVSNVINYKTEVKSINNTADKLLITLQNSLLNKSLKVNDLNKDPALQNIFISVINPQTVLLEVIITKNNEYDIYSFENLATYSLVLDVHLLADSKTKINFANHKNKQDSLSPADKIKDKQSSAKAKTSKAASSTMGENNHKDATTKKVTTAADPKKAVTSKKTPAVFADNSPSQNILSSKPQYVPKSSLSRALGLKVNKIVIDPGHGGKDPGAITGDIYEKNINLYLSQLVKKTMNQLFPKVEVVLTRSKDIFLDLEQRSLIARQQNADLFISIHANAHSNKELQGIETYYLNYSDDPAELAQASRENVGTTKSVVQLESLVKNILGNNKLLESQNLANQVQQTLISKLNTQGYKSQSLGVKKAPFIVLIGTDIPSILLEIGFLSNDQERKLLLNDDYLQTMALGIIEGIINFSNLNVQDGVIDTVAASRK